jgi:hypothetical protein
MRSEGWVERAGGGSRSSTVAWRRCQHGARWRGGESCTPRYLSAQTEDIGGAPAAGLAVGAVAVVVDMASVALGLICRRWERSRLTGFAYIWSRVDVVRIGPATGEGWCGIVPPPSLELNGDIYSPSCSFSVMEPCLLRCKFDDDSIQESKCYIFARSAIMPINRSIIIHPTSACGFSCAAYSFARALLATLIAYLAAMPWMMMVPL